MNPGNESQDIVTRLEQLEERCARLARRSRTLGIALVVVLLISLATPAFIAMRSSFGSKLRVGTLTADRLVVPYKGELVMKGANSLGTPQARFGYFSEGDWFGLALFDGKMPGIKLAGGIDPSLTFQAEHGGKTRLQLGYTGHFGGNDVEVVGEPMVDLVGHNGTRQATLSISGSDQPHFVLFDPEGKKRCIDMSVADGSSKITLRPATTKETQARLELSSSWWANPQLGLFDEKGQPIAPK